jgi:hypothetical protein
MLPALYRVYAQTLPVHQARCKSWYNHSGAVFPERFYLFGPIDSPTYGCDVAPRSPDQVTGLYQKYHIMGTLALCSLGLDDWDYHTGDEVAPSISRATRERMSAFILPICLNATTYYAEHYRSGPSGKLDLFPSQGEETWQCPQPHNRSECTTNPASDIAGLWAITNRMLRPDITGSGLLTSEQVSALSQLVQRIPELPVGPRPYQPKPTTQRVYLPASQTPVEGPRNSENIELHAVFPFRLTHIGAGDDSVMDIGVARTTFKERMFVCDANQYWCEDSNVAALLGLGDEAGADVLKAVSVYLSKTSPGWRFPIWHAGGGDTTPSLMPQSILRQSLHAMILQHNHRGELLLFPAWPAGWDVAFKLHAPRGTTVQGRCVNGSVTGLLVTPVSRRRDVRLMGCKTDDDAGLSSDDAVSTTRNRSNTAGLFIVHVAPSNTVDLMKRLSDGKKHRAMGQTVHLILHGRYVLDRALDLGDQEQFAELPRLHLHGPAILDGGVDVADWTRDTRRPWLYSAPVPKTLRGISITQMWDGQQRVLSARTPVLHYSKVGPINKSTSCTQSIVLDDPEHIIPRSFANRTTMLRLFLYHAWDISFHPIADIRPSVTKQNLSSSSSGLEIIVSNQIKTAWGVGAGAPGFRYWLEGGAEFLHAGSGTFAHDFVHNRLLYAPTDGVQPGATVVPRLTELVRADAANDVTLEALTFEHTAIDFNACFAADSPCEFQSAANTVVAALHWTNALRLQLHNVTVKHTGGFALWVGPGSRNVMATRLHLHDLGAGGVRITSSHAVTVADSVLEDGGHVWRSASAVLMQTANRSLVTHNLIRQFFYTGISIGWSWGFQPTTNGGSTISANDIHTIGQGELSDLGCIYHLGIENLGGTIIEDNACHNVSAFDYGGWGYYLDEGSSNVLVRRNLAYNTKSAGFTQHYGLNNTIINNIFYRVDEFNLGQTNWSDAGIASGAANTPGSSKDNSSFTFRRNVLVVGSGKMFAASTSNGFKHMHLDSNVYWSLSTPATQVRFPCNPDMPRDYISAPTCLHADHTQHVSSSNGLVTIGFNATGFFNLQHKTSGSVLWSAPYSKPPKGLNFSANQACLQFDAQLCVFERGSPHNTILWCAEKSSHPAHPYFAAVGDDCSFCIWGGSPVDPHPPFEEALWCAVKAPCPTATAPSQLQAGHHRHNAHVGSTLGSTSSASSEGFPTDCTLASWRAQGQDGQSVVANPQIAAPERNDWRLLDGSPALKLGFEQLSMSTVGPR